MYPKGIIRWLDQGVDASDQAEVALMLQWTEMHFWAQKWQE